MHFQQLVNTLKPIQGTVTLSTATIDTPKIHTLIRDCYNEAAIVINQATIQVDEIHKLVTIQGTSSYLHMPNLRVTAWCSINGSGHDNVELTLAYALLGHTPNPKQWNFAKSFPKLPFNYDFSTSFDAPQTPTLENLTLFNSYFITSTTQIEHFPKQTFNFPIDFAKPIEAGLNFMGFLKPEGKMGFLNNFLSGKSQLTLYGPIIIPWIEKAITPIPYDPDVFPWTVQWTVPGIMLKSDLDITISISDKIDLSHTCYRIYSPVTTSWIDKNPTYQTITALEGMVTLPLHQRPSQSIKANLTSKLLKGLDDVVIYSSIEGASLKHLDELANISGDAPLLDALVRGLPEELATAIKNLEQLELSELAIGLSPPTSAAATPAVPYVFFTVKMDIPGGWSLVQGNNWLVIENLAARFTVTDPFGKRDLTVSLIGTFEIDGTSFEIITDLPAPHDLSNLFVYAQADDSIAIPIHKVIEQFDLPQTDTTASHLMINSLVMNAYPKSTPVRCGFSMTMANDPAWNIDIGHSTLTISDVQLSFNYAGSMSASMSGVLQFAGNTITASYSTPGDFMVRGDLPKIQLTQLIDQVCNNTIPLPEGFDISLTDSTILIQKVAAEDTFFFATHVDTYGALVFQAVRENSKTGLALGFELGSGSISSLNGLSALEPLETFFQLSNLMLLVTSVDPSRITFPDLAKFHNPNITTTHVTIPHQAGANTGFYGYADVVFGSDGGQGTVAKLFGLRGSLGMVLYIGEKPAQEAKFFIDLNFTGADNKLEGCTLVGQLGVMLSQGKPSLFLDAKLSTTICSKPVQFEVTLLIVPNGAFISGTLIGSAPRFNLTDTVWVQLSNMAVEVGIDTAGIPSFGFTAAIDTSGGFDSAVSVFFNSANPTQSLLAGSISNLSLHDLVSTFAPGVAIPSWLADVMNDVKVKGLLSFTIDKTYADALDHLDLETISAAFATHGVTVSTHIQETLLVVNEPGHRWSLSVMDNSQGITHYQLTLNGNQIDVSLEAQLYLAPQDTMIGSISFPEGFKAIGIIKVFFLELRSQTAISPGQGIKINEEIEQIDWNVAGIDLFKVTGANGTGGARLSLCTYHDDEQQIDSLKNPHCVLSGALDLLDIERVSTNIQITQAGFRFALRGTYFVVDVALTGTFTKQADFALDGTASCEVGTLDLGAAGTIHLNSEVAVALAMEVTGQESALTLNATATFSVEVLGDSFTITHAQLTLTHSFFQHLPQAVATLIVDAILREPLKWLTWVKHGLVTVAEDVATLLKTVFNITDWQEAAQLMKNVGYEFGHIVDNICHAFAVSANDVGTFLASKVTACAMESVNSLTNAVKSSLYDTSHLFLSQMGASEDSQQLLHFYYDNQTTLEKALMENPQLWEDYVGTKANREAVATNPADHTIDVLQRLPITHDPAFETARAKAIQILNKYSGLHWDDFLKKLNDE